MFARVSIFALLCLTGTSALRENKAQTEALFAKSSRDAHREFKEKALKRKQESLMQDTNLWGEPQDCTKTRKCDDPNLWCMIDYFDRDKKSCYAERNPAWGPCTESSDCQDGHGCLKDVMIGVEMCLPTFPQLGLKTCYEDKDCPGSKKCNFNQVDSRFGVRLCMDERLKENQVCWQDWECGAGLHCEDPYDDSMEDLPDEEIPPRYCSK